MASGFEVEDEQVALSGDGHRYFGTLRLRSEIVAGVGLAVGIRNSTDKSFPIGFAAGSRVFVCDNLAFRSELVIARKHTRFGERRFEEAVSQAIVSLRQFQQSEAERISVYRNLELTGNEADAFLLRSFKCRVLNTRTLPLAIEHWENPRIDDFKPRTGWSLFNAVTSALKEEQTERPQLAAWRTIQLCKLIEEAKDESHYPVNAEPQ